MFPPDSLWQFFSKNTIKTKPLCWLWCVVCTTSFVSAWTFSAIKSAQRAPFVSAHREMHRSGHQSESFIEYCYLPEQRQGGLKIGRWDEMKHRCMQLLIRTACKHVILIQNPHTLTFQGTISTVLPSNVICGKFRKETCCCLSTGCWWLLNESAFISFHSVYCFIFLFYFFIFIGKGNSFQFHFNNKSQ